MIIELFGKTTQTNMKKRVLLLTLAVSCLALVGCAKRYAHHKYNEGINVIPVPVELTVTDTLKFLLTANTTIATNSVDLEDAAKYLADKIGRSTGYAITLASELKVGNAINFELDTRVPVGNEGYLLSATAESITIKARTPQGAFYGAQTLLQLLPAEIASPVKVNNIEWTIPCVEIKDEPRFKYRGFMMDVCRHFRTVDFIKKQLDILASYKINRFHWHLTDDQGWRIEIKKYPKLTELGSLRTEGDGSVYGPFFYTQDQIKEVVAYAAKLNIDVIPEIELPGHAMAVLIGHPQYSCTGGPFKQPRIIWGVEDEVFCVGKDATFDFLEDVIDEVVELFPSEYFHIGGDECPKVRWKTCPDCQARIKANGLAAKAGYSAEERLQSYAVNRVEKYLNGKGKKMIGWDEILEGGLTESAIVMSWRGTEGGIAAAKSGNEVIMTPQPNGMYIDHYQGAPEVEPVTIGGFSTVEKIYGYEPIPVELKEDQQHFILGVQNNLWSEYILTDEHYQYMMFPRLLALAEIGWSPNGRKDWIDFDRRLDNAMIRLDLSGINYHIPMPEGVVTQNIVYIGEGTKVKFTNTRGLEMVYTLDGTEPTIDSKVTNGDIELKGEGVLKIATKLRTGKLSKSRTIPFGKQELSPAKQITGAIKGAKLKIAEGLIVNPADYANARFSKDTVVSSLFEGKLWDYNKPSIGIFEGLVNLPEDGVYTFSSDMDELWIDGEMVIENVLNSRHYKNKVQKAMKAGLHQYKIVFNNRVKEGWPNCWNRIGFMFKVGNGEWTQANGENISYVK